jgi:hypothetical protein
MAMAHMLVREQPFRKYSRYRYSCNVNKIVMQSE